MHTRGLCGVCPSATFVYSLKTNNISIYLFWFFHAKRYGSNPAGPMHYQGFRMHSRKSSKLRFSTNIWLHRVLSTVQHNCAGPWHRMVTLIAGKRRRLLFPRQSVYDKKAQRYAEDNRTTFKPVVNVTPQLLKYCAVEANQSYLF